MIRPVRNAHRRLAILVVLAATTALVGCGGGSGSSLPTSDSLDQGAVIEGTVEATGAGISARSDVRASSGSSGIKVSAVGTGASTTTDASGGFVLEGLPAGSATLRFEARGIDATLRIDGLVVGQRLRIAVRVNGPTALLMGPFPAVSPNPTPEPPFQGSCFSAGAKAEVEGLIVAKEGASNGFIGSVTVAQQGKGNFLCEVGDATRIRHGNQTLTLDDLVEGSRVHVSGTGMPATTLCRVDAVEIKLQN